MRLLRQDPSLPRPNYSLLGEYSPVRRNNFRSWLLGRIGQRGFFVNAITQQTETGTAYKGGLRYAAGLGFRIPFSGNAGFLLSFGYRYQKTIVTDNDLPSLAIYRRLALRAGFYL
jgi:hypothetical protein